MAHRKPLGTTCQLPNFTWNGDVDDPPTINDCLVSTAGTAYLIIGVEECARRDRFNLLLERIGDPPEGARVIEFYWLSRDKR